MRYIGNFYSLKQERYTVEIITNNSSGTTKEITLGVSPFVTDMDTSDENIYKPVKYQGATINVITDNESDYKFDVYSSTANGTKIRLYDSANKLIWGGFATPVLYSNSYTSANDNLEIECIDGLSILQYYKYNASPKRIISFAEIVMKIISKCEVYKTLYVSDNMYRASNIPILNDMYISEQNFFDEKDDDETDDDVAWTLQEVLEEICKYLGYVCIGDGDTLYMLDYDAIKNKKNTYYKYTVGNYSTYTKVTLSASKNIESDDYGGSENKINLDTVYNKVTVKDDFYTFESVIPDLYENAINITKSSDDTLKESTQSEAGMLGEVISINPIGTTNKQDKNNNMIAFINRVYDPQHKRFSSYNSCFIKYFKSSNYTFYEYNSNINYDNGLNYTDTQNMLGAIIVKADIEQLDNPYDEPNAFNNYKKHTLDEWLKRNEKSTVNLSKYIMMRNQIGDSHIDNAQIQNYPYFKSNSVDTTALFGGDNAYLLIKGSYIWHYFDFDPYPIPETNDIDVSEGRYTMKKGQTYILAKLQWGNEYWNGTEWTTTDSTFKILYLNEDSSRDKRRADATIFKAKEFVNTVNWRIGTNEKGYMIPVPKGKVLAGLPQLTVYKPFDPEYTSGHNEDRDKGQHYKHSVVFLKDFDIKAIISDPSFSDVNKTDTVYTNVINEHYAQDMNEITFKICTHDNKSPNYSATAYKDSTGYHFIKDVTNNALGLTLTCEEILINRLCGQYKSPRIRLELNLQDNILPYTLLSDKWLKGKNFIVDSQSIDYYNNLATIILVEKNG